MMDNHDIRPSLLAPSVSQNKIDSVQKNTLKDLIATTQERDVNILERVASLAAGIFIAQVSQLPNVVNTNNVNKALAISTPVAASTNNPTYARIPVAGGTDITPVDALGYRPVNILGDLAAIILKNLLTTIFATEYAELIKSHAMSSSRAVDAAERSGNKGVEAEKQRMIRDSVSGSIGGLAQGTVALRTVKALNTESKSIANNLTAATRVETQQGLHQASIASSTDGLLHKGVPLNESVAAAMNGGTPITAGFSADKRHAHNQIQINSNKTKVTSDYINAVIHSGQKVIDGGFNIAAANETRQAELARADQSVNNEIANVHQQAAKKSAESGAALSQALDNMLNSKNSTLSSIAGAIH